MNEERIQDLLLAHGEALKRGEEHAVWLARQEAIPLEALPLLHMAYLLQQALTPLQTPAPFRRHLHQEIVGTVTASYSKMWVGAAAIGSVLSLAGLFLFWQRRKEPLSWGKDLNFGL